MNNVKLHRPTAATLARKIMKQLDECDSVLYDLQHNAYSAAQYIKPDGLSQGMRDALVGAVIERNASLIDQLRRLGLRIEEEV